MSETVSVNFSGPALAFLLYENVKSRNEQEGFLLGETNVIVTKTITDLDSHNVNLHKIININAVVPCPKTCEFYNNVGALNTQKLESILGSEIANVVAWYTYEPESRFKLSMRERFVHIELSKSGLFPIPTDLFTCCLLSSSTSHMESTHTYSHTFLRYKNNQFVTVPLHISNLGELTNCYKPKIPASKQFTELCQSIGLPKNGIFDLKLIDKIQDKLHTEVTNIMTKLSESEAIKEQLEKDYQNMKQEIDYYESLLLEKAIADAKADNENELEKESDETELEKLQNDLKNLIHFDSNKVNEGNPSVENLKNDLEPESKIKTEKKDVNKNINTKELETVKTEFGNCSGNTSLTNHTCNENLIDLTTEEDKSDVTRSNNKLSYANMMKKNVQNP